MTQMIQIIRNIKITDAEYDAVVGMGINTTTHPYDLPHHLPSCFFTKINVWGRTVRIPYLLLSAHPLPLSKYIIVWRELFKKELNAIGWTCHEEYLEACRKCYKQWRNGFWTQLSNLGKYI